ncbi:MAG: type I methionyl aminopeptidase [Nitrospirae bacterium]|nr:type I methionyl aminopeptidase [Nitrospirota bacterium]
MIDLKSKEELAIIGGNCQVLAELFLEMGAWVQAGVSAIELDRQAEDWIVKRKSKPAFKGYRGYPATLCVSINDEVVHGIPRKDKLFKAGDVVGVDCGLQRKGFYADMAYTYAINGIEEKTQRLLDAARESLFEGIREARVGNRLFDISHAIQSHVETRGYSVVREFVGHGIGRQLHEDPQVPNFGEKGKGIRLVEGMVLAIEPMVNAGAPDVTVDNDGWTVRTKDGRVSAHFEHTIAITSDGPRILTEKPR